MSRYFFWDYFKLLLSVNLLQTKVKNTIVGTENIPTINETGSCALFGDKLNIFIKAMIIPLVSK